MREKLIFGGIDFAVDYELRTGESCVQAAAGLLRSSTPASRYHGRSVAVVVVQDTFAFVAAAFQVDDKTSFVVGDEYDVVVGDEFAVNDVVAAAAAIH